jgi:hypothetical protein
MHRVSLADCVESFLKDSHLLKIKFLQESLQFLQVGKQMSTGALNKYQLDGLFKTSCLVGICCFNWGGQAVHGPSQGNRQSG